MAEMAALDQEHLKVLLLNTKNEVMSTQEIYVGNVNSAVVRVAEVFRPAIRDNAPSIIVAHNHPSGDPTPSPEDVAITRELVAAGKLLGIELLDHVVIGSGNRYISLNEKRLGFS
jgi:DNA repair protein RadC